MKFKLIIVFVLLVVLFGAFTLVNDKQKNNFLTDSNQSVSFTIIENRAFGFGFGNGPKERVLHKIHTIEELELYLSGYYQGEAFTSPPLGYLGFNVNDFLEKADIDFTKEMLLVFWAGWRGSGGYEMDVKSLLSDESGLKAYVQITKPGRSCTVTLAITYPHQIIKIDKTDHDIEWVEMKDKITRCFF